MSLKNILYRFCTHILFLTNERAKHFVTISREGALMKLVTKTETKDSLIATLIKMSALLLGTKYLSAARNLLPTLHVFKIKRRLKS